MHALSPDRYLVWQTLASPNARRWCRVWLDGLYSGTHPYWGFRLVSPSCLARFWYMFQAEQPKDYTKQQRTAIQQLVRRWSSSWRGIIGPPNVPDSDSDSWNEYFDYLRDADNALLDNTIQAVAGVLTSENRNVDWDTLAADAANMASVLVFRGRTRRELITGVLEDLLSSGNLNGSDPLVDVVLQVKNARSQDYIVWTTLNSRDYMSRNFRRNVLSAVRLSSEADVLPANAGSIFFGTTLETERTFVMSRHCTTHREVAVDLHRQTALASLVKRPATVQVGVTLAPTSFVQLVDRFPSEPPFESKNIKDQISISLKRTTGTEPDRIVAAALLTFRDEPERGIQSVCDKLDQCFPSELDRKVASKYSRTLRSVLRRHLAEFLLHLGHIWSGVAAPKPDWIEYIVCMCENGANVSFEEVEKRIRNDVIGDDEIVAQRLRLVLHAGEIDCPDLGPLLMIARGIRNKMTHYTDHTALVASIPLDLRQRLLNLLLHAYGAATNERSGR